VKAKEIGRKNYQVLKTFPKIGRPLGKKRGKKDV
jgi:hypothetical protein